MKPSMRKFLKTLGLSHQDNQCVNEFWTQHFDKYFQYYTVQVTTFVCEVDEPNQTEPAQERKETSPQTLLSYINLTSRSKSQSA